MSPSPEALAVFGLIDGEEYLRLTAHYGQEHHMKQQKYRDAAKARWALQREKRDHESCQNP